MASRLEEHEKTILDQLARGRSYTSIAKELNDVGCQTSHTNIFQWIKRRAARIESRQSLINPGK